MSKRTAVLQIADKVYGKISQTKRGFFFVLCDQHGTHVSISRTPESKMHVEISSDEQLGSVWDQARIGIARGRGWPKAARHANYLVNRQYDIPNSEPLLLVAFERPEQPPEQKAKYRNLPRLCLKAKPDWRQLAVSVMAIAPDDSDPACAYPLGWAWLVFTITK